MDGAVRTHTVNGRAAVQRGKYVMPGLICLMAAIALERVTFYIVVTNMPDFFRDVQNGAVLTNSTVPVTAYLIFAGTTDFLPLFGGMLGDLMLSRYAWILIGFLIEAAGSCFLLALMIISDLVKQRESDSVDYGMMAVGLVLMSIGLGFQRANILAFGCKQVTQHTLQKENVKAIEKFFRCYFWVSNIGGLLALILTSVADGYRGPSDDLHIHYHRPTWYLGIVQTVTVTLGALLIIIGKRWYIRTAPDGENLKRLSRSFFLKIQVFLKKVTSVVRRYPHNSSFEHSGSSRETEREENEILIHLFRILLIAASLIMFGIIYSLEIGEIFYLQGQTMNTQIAANKTIPLNIMKSSDSLTVIFLLPFIHYVISPCLDRRDKGVSLLKRIGIGLLFGLASALSCGILETVRQHLYLGCSRTCVSILWQCPQFIFLALGEIYVLITNLQFLYIESPPNLQGFVLGIHFCLMGFGSYMARVLLEIVIAGTGTGSKSWYPVDFNHGHVEYLLFLLALCQFFFFLIYSWNAYKYNYKYLDANSTYRRSYMDSERTSLNSHYAQTRNYASISTVGSNSNESLDSLIG